MMIRGLYQRNAQEKRFLALPEAAMQCRVSLKKIRNWLVRQVSPIEMQGGNQIEVGDLLKFLVSHHMPVPASLLPKNTGKIMFIVANETMLTVKQPLIDTICRRFLEHHAAALIETAVLSRETQLTILTFRPETTVLFIAGMAEQLGIVEVVGLLESLPGARMLLIISGDSRKGGRKQLREGLIQITLSENDLAGADGNDPLHNFFTS